ncbi:uncharacterized protein F5Z01DRAFT_677642 [Emericellopsis atlantica]|uniref:Uncharacterized protein n=1 Tax=Emericellopsis atlantica TaxID=2614577 RepID=A0A9P8CKF7_9HYPO|nr:uncharacterized protein F5Z01DRAFT_677642 [Emericellopsis atlantica]KAG9250514.1 hypothetical protein F5Z01DRAFT_677642 [Emericellopsis atlantica]
MPSTTMDAPRVDDHAAHMVVYQITLSALIITLIALIGSLGYINWRYWKVRGQGVKAVELAQKLMEAVRRRDDQLDDIEAQLMNSQHARGGSRVASPRIQTSGRILNGPAFVVGDDSDDDDETVVGTVCTGHGVVVTPTRGEKQMYMPHKAVLVDEDGDDDVDDFDTADFDQRSVSPPPVASGRGRSLARHDMNFEMGHMVATPVFRTLA